MADQIADAEPAVLAVARGAALEAGVLHAGHVTPTDAWVLVQSEAAVLVDVRTPEERAFVGRVAQSVHVPWASGTSLSRNPRFVRELDLKAGRDRPLLLMSRGTARASAAAEAATRAGRRDIFVVLQGFEGELDDTGRRGRVDGWRRLGLPWIQD
jgi:rhodanese-related sulfurtransferase